MSCFFLVDVYMTPACGSAKHGASFGLESYINENKGRGSYEDYIEKVKPIVESYGGEYLARTEDVTVLSPLRRPDRVIIIRFPSRESLDACFASPEYRQIMHERIDSVDARAIIVEEERLSARHLPPFGGCK